MFTVRLQESNRNYRIGKIVCLGRNYAEHIRELGNEPSAEPVIFIKPATSAIRHGEKVTIPPYSQDCHHEVELAVLIGSYGRGISPENTADMIVGYGVALDMTLRDVQNRLKEKGLPWELAKGFDTSCPLSDFAPASRIDDPHDLAVSLRVNGELRQQGSTSQMIRRIPEIVSYISSIFTLEPGDIILTGTPQGVARVASGDRLCAEIEQIGTLEVSVQ
jgi:5-carboxymethyl-2-hydroxymuconate isomerase